VQEEEKTLKKCVEVLYVVGVVWVVWVMRGMARKSEQKGLLTYIRTGCHKFEKAS
jgi:hypothetical protein